MGKDQPDKPDGSSSPEVAAWVTDAKPSIAVLMAAANRIPGVVSRGPEAARDAALALYAAAVDAREWLSEHPCPKPELGEEFANAFAAFTKLAEEATIASAIAGYDSEELDEKAGQVVADLMLAMYDTSADDRTRER